MQPVIYVISEGEDGPCKVGIALYPAGRLALLQIGNPRLLTVAHIEPSSRLADDALVERRAHGLLDANRLRGEWFAVPVTEAVSAVQAAVKELEAYARRYYRTSKLPPEDTPARRARELITRHPLARR